MSRPAIERVERGAKIGEYTVGEPLGEGGFGAVYRGYDGAGAPAAVKVFKDSGGAATAQRLLGQQNEIEALLRLRHPALVKLYSYGVLEGTGLYLVMELVEGETLERYLATMGRLDTIEAIRIIRRVAEALAHCHAHNVLHLDLKPSNILLSDPHEPRLKILDFGLATLTASFQAEHARVTAGTVAYLAPESLRTGALARPGPRMDLYAIGVMLYELLTGQLPFSGSTVGDIIRQKMSGALIPLAALAPETPAPVVALVEELLERDPARRFASAARLSARLKELYYVTLQGDGAPSGAGGGAPSGAGGGTDSRGGAGDARSPQAGRGGGGGVDDGLDDVPFVGRIAELARLTEVIAAAIRGQAWPAVVVGDAGVGKSRLVAEVLGGVEQAGAALVAYGRCRELSGLVPYSAFREALAQIALWLGQRHNRRSARIRTLIAGAIAEDGGLLRGLVPELAEAVGVAGADTAIGPGGTRWVADVLVRLLGAIAEEIPIFLVIEDLHWADEATHQVLDRLAGGLGTLPILLLGTSRATAPPRGSPSSAPASQLTSSWLSWKKVERIDLEPLPPEDNRSLLAALCGGASDDVLGALVRSVPLLGAGNPLFNLQILRNLETGGLLQRARSGALELSSRIDDDYQAPASVSDVLRRSIDALAPASVRVLGVAALIGRQFLRDDLCGLGLFEPAEVDRALQGAAERYLCRTADGGRTSFSHDVARELLVASIPPEERIEHHRRIARRVAQRGDDPGTLAHHLERAGELDQAATTYLAAGLAADRLQDPHGASGRFREALKLLEQLPLEAERNELRARCAHELARVGCLLGSTDAPLAVLRRAAAALPESPLVTATLSSALSRVHYVRGEFADAVEHSRRALAAIGESPALRPYQCLPANILGRALCAAGKVGLALDPLRRGCELAEAAGEYIELCHSRGILCVALSNAGLFAEAEQSCAEAARIAERLRDPARLLGTWFYYAVLGEARFDWELGVRSTTRLLSYAEEHGLSGLYLYVGTMYAGRHQFHIGQLHRARVLLSNACNLSQVLGIGMGRGWAEGYLGDVLFVQGRLVEALACYERAVVIGATATGDAYATSLGRIGRAHVQALGGIEAGELRRQGEETLAFIRGSGNRSLLVTALERYAESLDAVGDRDGAGAAREEHRALARELGLTAPSFWPRPPADALASSEAPSARQYWSALPREVRSAGSGVVNTTHLVGTGGGAIEEAETVAVTGEGSAKSAPRNERTLRHVTLLETLASVEGYVPRFEKR